MDRLSEVDHLYNILYTLEAKCGTRVLATCNSRMEWPRQGVCFFFQPGELRENGRQMRIVRIETAHSGKGSQSPLWDSLREVRGTVSGKFAGGGDHRNSDFRRQVGNALIARDNIACSSWNDRDRANAGLRKAEHSLEVKVSQQINSMHLLWISTERSAKPEQLSQFIKQNTVSLLSNYRRSYRCDPPSPHWLGHYCSDPKVALSGLWNSRYVDISYNLKFLGFIEKLVRLR